MKPLVLAVLIVVALSGCVADLPIADATHASTGSAVPTSTPTPTPTPTTTTVPLLKPDLSDLIVSFEGFGPVTIGTDLASLDPATSIFVNEPIECETGMIDQWRANYDGHPLGEGNSLRAFEVGRAPESFLGVRIYDPRPHTAAGIHVGSSLDDLLAAHPDAEYVNSGSGRDRYVLYGSPASLLFDVQVDDNGLRAAGTIAVLGLTAGDPARGRPNLSSPLGC